MSFAEAWAIYLDWVSSGRDNKGVPHLSEALTVLEASQEEMEENGYSYL